MPMNLDSSFSVYHLVERLQNVKTQLLQDRKTMNVISYEIENATIIDHAKTRIFSSFQRMSRFLPQVKRYEKLAQNAEAIYVFGIPDVKVPDVENITYIPIEPHFQLAKEWFLVSFGRPFASALATQELTHIDDPDNTRQFRGVWTFDVGMVAILEEWLTRIVDAEPQWVTEEDVDYDNKERLVSNIYHRMMKRIGTNTLQPTSIERKTTKTDTKENLRAVIRDTLQPQLYNSKISAL